MDIEQYLRFAGALLFVLALIMILARVLRRTSFGAGSGVHPKLRRLAVIESLGLDTKRRLVLIRRDGHEHLILLGPAGDILVETIPPRDIVTARNPENFKDVLATSAAKSSQPAQPEPGGETA